jgi:hypothetical protein
MGANRRLRDIPRQALVFTPTLTTKSFTIKGGVGPPSYSVSPGKAVLTLIEIPNWANEVTAEFIVTNPNGIIMFHRTNLARNQTSPPVMLREDDDENDADYPVFEGCVVTLTLSAVPGDVGAGVGGTAYVTIYYK